MGLYIGCALIGALTSAMGFGWFESGTWNIKPEGVIVNLILVSGWFYIYNRLNRE